jgi:hypothetical protein
VLYCITTASADELLSGDLDQYLASVENQQLRVVLILRGVSDENASRYIADPKIEAVLRIQSGGISKVRNMGLRYLETLNLAEYDVVSFPDDDCRYPASLCERVAVEFQRTGAELIVGSYGERELADEEFTTLTADDAAYRSSSVALFVRWSLVRKIGGFNEALGVGSGVFSYGEDNDFALRAFRASSLSIRKESLRVWHLEVRPTTGRNPKGYLTSCVLNLQTPGVWKIVLRGLVSSVIQDLQSFHRPFRYMQFCATALHPVRLRQASFQQRLTVAFFRPT